AEMFDVHGMIGSSRVQVGDAERTAVFRFCVVVLATEAPLAGWRFCSPLAHCHLKRGDGAEIAIHHAQMRKPGCGRVRVGVDEARQRSEERRVGRKGSEWWGA